MPLHLLGSLDAVGRIRYLMCANFHMLTFRSHFFLHLSADSNL